MSLTKNAAQFLNNNQHQHGYDSEHGSDAARQQPLGQRAQPQPQPAVQQVLHRNQRARV